MREQDPKQRVKNFERSRLRLSLEDALREAERCLYARTSRASRLPGRHRHPGFIQKIAEKNFHGAYDVITDTNLLPAVCGRVCPQENQCEGVCTVGDIARAGGDRPARALRRRHGDRAKAGPTFPTSSRPASRSASSARVPAGMACAADMAKAGCDVTVYEAFHEPGGVLKYGIPTSGCPTR